MKINFVYFHKKEHNKAIAALLKALHSAKTIDNLYLIEIVNNQLVINYIAINDRENYKLYNTAFLTTSKKVEGIEGKITQLVDVMGKLLASGLSGVYEVAGLESKLILQEPVRSVFFSPSLQQLVIGTYAEKVKTLETEIEGWRETNLIDSLNDFISHSFEDRLENIWLCGRKNIYEVETVDGGITDIISYPISNSFRDETVGLSYGNDIYIAASGQFSRFDLKTNSFIKYKIKI